MGAGFGFIVFGEEIEKTDTAHQLRIAAVKNVFRRLCGYLAFQEKGACKCMDSLRKTANCVIINMEYTFDDS